MDKKDKGPDPYPLANRFGITDDMTPEEIADHAAGLFAEVFWKQYLYNRAKKLGKEPPKFY